MVGNGTRVRMVVSFLMGRKLKRDRCCEVIALLKELFGIFPPLFFFWLNRRLRGGDGVRLIIDIENGIMYHLVRSPLHHARHSSSSSSRA